MIFEILMGLGKSRCNFPSGTTQGYFRPKQNQKNKIKICLLTSFKGFLTLPNIPQHFPSVAQGPLTSS
jgi:hypothetical protein